MATPYCNKFIVENTGGNLRIVFSDERARIAEGLPMPISEVASVVMNEDNARQLARLILKVFDGT